MKRKIKDKNVVKQYAGNTGSSYANPHAPTTQNGLTYTYNKTGNVTGKGTNTYTWTYDNLLKQSADTLGTTTYKYAPNSERVSKTKGSITTLSPFSNYEVVGATTTKYVMVNGIPFTTIEDNASSSHTYHLHADHLGSTNLVSNDLGTIAQTITYTPYGTEKTTAGAQRTNKHFIGQTIDSESSLSYLNARYYDSGRGEFLSEDPVFNEIGQTQDGKKVLFDPQQQNSYGYAGDNPVG